MILHKERDSYQSNFVVWLSLGQLISWGSIFYTFSIIMGPVEQTLGLTRAESSIGFSLSLLAEGLVSFPVGRWIDRGFERRVMTAGSLLAGLCLLAHGFVQGKAGFYIVWMGLGVAMAATLYNPAFAVVTRRFPSAFRRAIITLTFLGGLASTVFIPLTSGLIHLLGWRQALACLAALHCLFCAPLHWLLLRHAPTSQQPHAVIDEVNSSSLSGYLLSAPFLLIGVFVVLMMAITAALPAHMLSLLREHGLSEVWVILIPASIGVIQVLGRLLLYFFEQHFDLHVANLLIPCLIPIGLLALQVAPWTGSAEIAVVLLFVLLWGLGNGMLTIVKGTAVAQYVNRDHVASLNGALGIPLALARSLAPFALGLMWTSEAGYTSGLWLLLGLSVIAVASLMLAQRLSRYR